MSCKEMRKRLENAIWKMADRQAELGSAEWDPPFPGGRRARQEAIDAAGEVAATINLAWNVCSLLDFVEAYEGIDHAKEAFDCLEQVVRWFEAWPQATPEEVRDAVIAEFRKHQAHWAWGDELKEILASDLD